MLPQPTIRSQTTKKYRHTAGKKDADGASEDDRGHDYDRVCGSLGCPNKAYARVRHPTHGSIVVCDDEGCIRNYEIIEVFSQ